MGEAFARVPALSSASSMALSQSAAAFQEHCSWLAQVRAAGEGPGSLDVAPDDSDDDMRYHSSAAFLDDFSSDEEDEPVYRSLSLGMADLEVDLDEEPVYRSLGGLVPQQNEGGAGSGAGRAIGLAGPLPPLLEPRQMCASQECSDASAVVA